MAIVSEQMEEERKKWVGRGYSVGNRCHISVGFQAKGNKKFREISSYARETVVGLTRLDSEGSDVVSSE